MTLAGAVLAAPIAPPESSPVVPLDSADWKSRDPEPGVACGASARRR